MLLAGPAGTDNSEVDPLGCSLEAATHVATLPRSFFRVERFRFDSKIRLFKPRGRGEFFLRIFSRCDISADRRSLSCRSKAARKRSRASFRFIACERESCTVTLRPEGRWRSVTAVETLFTFCPPGPPERANISSRSVSRIGRIKAAVYSRGRNAEVSPSTPAHSGTWPRARRIFLPLNFPSHRKHPRPG